MPSVLWASNWIPLCTRRSILSSAYRSSWKKYIHIWPKNKYVFDIVSSFFQMRKRWETNDLHYVSCTLYIPISYNRGTYKEIKSCLQTKFKVELPCTDPVWSLPRPVEEGDAQLNHLEQIHVAFDWRKLIK